MKMKQEHYDYLKAAIEKAYDLNPGITYETYKNAGLSAMRYRWDCLHAANILTWTCDVLYTYLHDTHIDTALKAITKTN